MTEWSPPIDSGLSGDLYLEEDLAHHVDELREAHHPGVYALKLSVPDSRAVVEERWARQYEVDVPDWIWSAFDADGVVYVGGARNVFARLYDHLEEPNRTASICHVFPPHSVWGLWWFDDETRAFERESGIAIDIRNKHPTLYVHQS